jgi:tRNA threonylcarbamoyladenosine biosynthesis protein TsaB
VTAIAVGVGPGTFTGLRIGVATARGLAQGLGVPLHPVSSLEALAAGIAAGAGAVPGTPILPLIDARRGQVFASLHLAGDHLRREWGPVALSPDDLDEHIARAVQPPLAAGDWALESLERLEAAGAVVPAPESGLHAIDPLQVCRLARETDPCAPERVKPVYVRQPDAEISRSARHEAPADGPA